MLKSDPIRPPHSRLMLAAGALAGVFLAPVFLADQVFAQQRASGGGNPCAVYGADFVAAQGTGACVRIGGRVRLEMNSGSAGHAYAPLSNFPAAPFPALGAERADGPARAHMRVGGAGIQGRR